MKVSDFIHGTQLHSPGPKGRASGIPRGSRQRNADLARVNVPVTRLDVSNHQSAFDTDLEGVDDSTTTISFTRDRGSEPTSPALQPRVVRGAEKPYRPPTRNGYKSIAEQIKELDSDDEYASDSTSIQLKHLPQEGTKIERLEEDIGLADDQDENFAWNGDIPAPNRERLGWQKIEAILRVGSQQPVNEPEDQAGEHVLDHRPENPPPPNDEGFQLPIVANTQFPDDTGPEGTRPAPRAIPRLSTPGRFSTRSRFAAHHPYPAANGHAGNLGQTASHPNSQEPSVPRTPGKRLRSPVDGYTETQHHNGMQFTTHEQYQDHSYGIFDTATELSTLDTCDDFDDNEHQEPTTTLSPRLSAISRDSSGEIISNFVSDYPPNILQSKLFSDLQAESFDYNPAPSRPIFPPQDPPMPLADKLSRLKTLTDDQRRTFFSTLTLSEWEESGDWLIDQFGSILQKTKAARQARRKVASIFENEIKRRYDNVNQEGETIKKRLEEMRTGGMGVLKGQSP
ncbi:hypothetical protein FQN57_005987 [Myotisia sp. PD_48]|nr:hypothetical protein FQN57_005987 [Myotisia sp. PD_48]